MLFSHFGRRENRNKRCGGCGLFYVGTAVRILSFDQAHRADYFEPKGTGDFNGVDRGSSRRADIVDDHDGRAGFAEAFDALAGSVLLFGFANQEAMQRAACDSHGDDNWVSAQGESADGGWFPALLANFFQKYLAD